MMTTIAGIENVAKAVDIFAKLREKFQLSAETRKKSLECQNKLEKIAFKKFDETYSCKSLKEIPTEEFENFVLERLQKRLGFSDTTKDSLLDGMYVGENEEKVTECHFKDGEGSVHHGRFITMKRNGKIDVAYAIYKLSFELAKQQIAHKGSYEWWFGILPIGWNDPHTTEKIQNLSESEKNSFSDWCQVKLYDHVALECTKV